MTDFWRSLGRKEAINWISVVLLLFIQLNGSLLADYQLELEGKIVLFWVANALPFVPMALVLLAGRYVINPLLPQALRPVSTLLIFEIAIVLRLFTFDSLLMGFGITEVSQFWTRFGAAQANQLIVLVVIGYLVSSARDYSAQNSQLASLIAATKTSQLDLQTRLAERRQSLVRMIESQLETSLQNIEGKNSKQDAEQLKNVIDSVVRPLSHQLGRGVVGEKDSLADVPDSRIQFRVLIYRSFTDNPFYPLLSVVWVFFPLLTTVASYEGVNALLVSVLFSLALITALYTARFLWSKIPTRLGLTFRLIAFVSVPLSLALFFVWFFNVLEGVDSFDKIGMLFFYFLAILSTITLVGTSRRILREMNVELRDANAEVKRELVQENSEARHFEEAVSRVLHGPIQDAIWASILRIENFKPGSKLTPKNLEYVRQPITDALVLLKEPDSITQNIEESLQELIKLWSGAVTIQLDIEPQLMADIAASDRTNSALTELLREAISNAIRHGDATEVTVKLRKSIDGKDIELQVSNNGSPFKRTSTPGIGTQLLNDLTLSWSRSNNGKMVVLEAVVPLITDTYK